MKTGAPFIETKVLLGIRELPEDAENWLVELKDRRLSRGDVQVGR
jgi:hypothetical protein